MKRGGGPRHLSIFLLFAGLALVAAFASRRPSPAGVAEADLGALEAKMSQDARLHPATPTPPPPGTAHFCRECHPAPPHPGEGIGPAMRNQHAQWMDCLLCHWSAGGGPRPRAVWQPWPTPSRQGERRELLALYPPAAPPREELLRLRSAATARQRCFERGPSCRDCHRPGEISPLARSGSSPERIASLERLENYFLLAPGEKWYFPQFR